MHIDEFEDLLQGMEENAEEMKKEIGNNGDVLEGDSAIQYLLNNQ